MAVAMGATDEVQPQLIELSRHENVAVRKEAVAALGNCLSNTARQGFRSASRDAQRQRRRRRPAVHRATPTRQIEPYRRAGSTRRG